MKTARHVTTDFDRALRTREIANEEAAELRARERATKNLDFVQFQREGMKQFVSLIRRSPAAAQALIVMATFMSRANAIDPPIVKLCRATGTSRATMSRALQRLCDEGWIKSKQVGRTKKYQINSNVFWAAARNMKAVGDIFSARINPPIGAIESVEIMKAFQALYVPTIIEKKKKKTI